MTSPHTRRRSDAHTAPDEPRRQPIHMNWKPDGWGTTRVLSELNPRYIVPLLPVGLGLALIALGLLALVTNDPRRGKPS